MPYLRVVTKKIIETRTISETRSRSRLYYALSEIGVRGDEIITEGTDAFRIYKTTVERVLGSLLIKDPHAQIRETGYTFGDIKMILEIARDLSPADSPSIEFNWD